MAAAHIRKLVAEGASDNEILAYVHGAFAVRTPLHQKPAPEFSGTAVINKEFKQISLSQYRGKWVVLFFYPVRCEAVFWKRRKGIPCPAPHAFCVCACAVGTRSAAAAGLHFRCVRAFSPAFRACCSRLRAADVPDTCSGCVLRLLAYFACFAMLVAQSARPRSSPSLTAWRSSRPSMLSPSLSPATATSRTWPG